MSSVLLLDINRREIFRATAEFPGDCTITLRCDDQRLLTEFPKVKALQLGADVTKINIVTVNLDTASLRMPTGIIATAYLA